MSGLASMTGFARTSDADSQARWVWELRSVNGRGLELRFKLPAGLDRIEPQLRALATGRLARGTVHVSLSLQSQDESTVVIDRALLARLAAEAQALRETGAGAPAPRAELLLALPGVIRRESGDATQDVPAERLELIMAGFTLALEQLTHTRHAEGGRLDVIVRGLLAQLAILRERAAEAAADQPKAQQARMMDALDRLLKGGAPVPEERLAQEVAILASRSDVTEEIDRLGSHLAAADALLSQGGPAGRQLDFLVQEILRETNTLCSKSASAALTALGLQMKAIIEQIREQVQNIE